MICRQKKEGKEVRFEEVKDRKQALGFEKEGPNQQGKLEVEERKDDKPWISMKANSIIYSKQLQKVNRLKKKKSKCPLILIRGSLQTKENSGCQIRDGAEFAKAV